MSGGSEHKEHAQSIGDNAELSCVRRWRKGAKGDFGVKQRSEREPLGGKQYRRMREGRADLRMSSRGWKKGIAREERTDADLAEERPGRDFVRTRWNAD